MSYAEVYCLTPFAGSPLELAKRCFSRPTAGPLVHELNKVLLGTGDSLGQGAGVIGGFQKERKEQVARPKFLAGAQMNDRGCTWAARELIVTT